MTSGALQRGLVTLDTASVLAGPSMQARPKSAILTCSRGLSLQCEKRQDVKDGENLEVTTTLGAPTFRSKDAHSGMFSQRPLKRVHGVLLQACRDTITSMRSNARPMPEVTVHHKTPLD
jgi:hypothetical protein